MHYHRILTKASLVTTAVLALTTSNCRSTEKASSSLNETGAPSGQAPTKNLGANWIDTFKKELSGHSATLQATIDSLVDPPSPQNKKSVSDQTQSVLASFARADAVIGGILDGSLGSLGSVRAVPEDQLKELQKHFRLALPRINRLIPVLDVAASSSGLLESHLATVKDQVDRASQIVANWHTAPQSNSTGVQAERPVQIQEPADGEYVAITATRGVKSALSVAIRIERDGTKIRQIHRTDLQGKDPQRIFTCTGNGTQVDTCKATATGTPTLREIVMGWNSFGQITLTGQITDVFQQEDSITYQRMQPCPKTPSLNGVRIPIYTVFGPVNGSVDLRPLPACWYLASNPGEKCESVCGSVGLLNSIKREMTRDNCEIMMESAVRNWGGNITPNFSIHNQAGTVCGVDKEGLGGMNIVENLNNVRLVCGCTFK